MLPTIPLLVLLSSFATGQAIAADPPGATAPCALTAGALTACQHELGLVGPAREQVAQAKRALEVCADERARLVRQLAAPRVNVGARTPHATEQKR